MDKTPPSCFNPCCVGLVLKTLDASRGRRTFLGFQSLLCWISPEDVELSDSGSLEPELFQSLLCWISPEDDPTSLTRIGRKAVSILVVLD